MKSVKTVKGRGKVGSRSGVAALKRKSVRAVRHSSKQVLDDLAVESDDRADAKLADTTYAGQHPAGLAETRVLAGKKTVKKKKKSTPAAALAKKRAAAALQKELDEAARHKAQRRAKRRAAARALKRAREE